ncbi:MAG: alpha-galactosidase [Planctomycetes bacterium]|nr:alpha-galactosidase [Planctomycetota bacterium]
MSRVSKRRSTALLLAAALLAAAAAVQGIRAGAGPMEESAARDARSWMDAARERGQPFSFRLGGEESSALLAAWPLERATREIDAERRETSETWKDPRSGLSVRRVTVEYHDFAALEWTVYFKNESTRDSPVIAGIRALDALFPCGAESEVVLHHHTGSPCTQRDYEPHATALESGALLRFAPPGGRPSDSVLPYFSLAGPGRGVSIAVGWPGQWAAEFARSAGAADAGGSAGAGESGASRQSGAAVRAGQERTHLVLHPGEEIRTPLVALLFWRGDWIDGQNRWRRWMLAHNLPRPGGRLPPPQLAACSSHQFGEMIHADSESQKHFVDRYLAEGLKLDYWWMDAGWYLNRTGWPNVGTWEVDTQRFPGGLRPITDHARARGVRSIVWFEPERVTPGTWLYEKRPDWLLSAGDSSAGLQGWRQSEDSGPDPCVTYNPAEKVKALAGIRWEPGRLAFHPGPEGEYAVVRWTAPAAGEYSIDAVFLAIDEQTTTDVHVIHQGRSLFRGWIRLEGCGPRALFRAAIDTAKGDAVDFIVGRGDGSHACDSTGLEVRIRRGEAPADDAARQFSAASNPAGPWSYGHLPPGPTPDSSTMERFAARFTVDEAAGQRLLDLGNPEARRWLTEHVDGLIRSEGIDLYRNDFNIDPLPYWRAADAEDRQGMAENRYVSGYLAYWDELRRRHPDMLIDSCASGGRRNDLETLRRAVPLLRSDYILEPVGQQLHTYGIAFWMPYYGTGVSSADPYTFRSAMCPHLTACYDVRRTDLPYGEIRRLMRQWIEVRDIFFGDYYPLTPYSAQGDAWIGWQFDLPEEGRGLVQAFRRADSGAAARTIVLRGLAAGATYEVRDLDLPDRSERRKGAELMERGVAISIPARPGAALLTYRRQ